MNSLSQRAPLAILLSALLVATGCGGEGLLSGGVGIVGLIVVVFQIWAIIEVVQSRKDTGTKVVWVLVVLLLPVIGTILWFLIGRK